MTPGADQSGWPSGSGSGSVTSRANRSRPASAITAAVSSNGPRPTLTTSAPSEQPGEERRVDDVAGGVGEREHDDHDVLGGPVDVGGGDDRGRPGRPRAARWRPR